MIKNKVIKSEGLIGKKFGKLIVISLSHIKIYRGRKKHYWNCICECGNLQILLGHSLMYHHAQSCGCIRKAAAIQLGKNSLSKDPRKTSALQIYSNNYKDGDITFEKFIELSQQNCFYCNATSNNSNFYNKYSRKTSTVLENIESGNFYYNGLDRVDNSKPHNLDNVVPCCKHCNMAKRTRSYDDFIAWIKQAAKHLAQKETDSNCLESVSEISVTQKAD